jgi:hypothetical protein
LNESAAHRRGTWNRIDSTPCWLPVRATETAVSSPGRRNIERQDAFANVGGDVNDAVLDSFNAKHEGTYSR